MPEHDRNCCDYCELGLAALKQLAGPHFWSLAWTEDKQKQVRAPLPKIFWLINYSKGLEILCIFMYTCLNWWLLHFCAQKLESNTH